VKRKLAAAILAFSSTIGLAHADVIQIFDVIGLAAQPKPTQFSGLLKIDVTTGALLAADVVFPGLPKFTGAFPVQPDSGDVEMVITTEVSDPDGNATLYLVSTSDQSGSLVGYTGGTINGAYVIGDPLDGGTQLYVGLSGSILPALTGVPSTPEPATSTLVGIGLTSLLCFAGPFRRARQQAEVG
jgi:hypothetical protein